MVMSSALFDVTELSTSALFRNSEQSDSVRLCQCCLLLE